MDAVSAAVIPCLIALVTGPCLNDVAAWGAVPDAVLYHVEGRSVQPGIASIEWTIHTTELRYFVGCQPEDQAVHVWAVDAAGNHSRRPARVWWETGELRFLDDSNGPASRWRGRSMCDLDTSTVLVAPGGE